MIESPRNALLRERISVGLFLLLLAATVAHILHDAWIRDSAGYAHVVATTGAPPTLYAPAAYRVAMPWLASFGYQQHLPQVPGPAIVTGFDFVFLALTLGLLYLIAVDDPRLAATFGPRRGMTLALTFVFAALGLEWLAQYVRLETMPTALYVAATLYCLRRRGAAALLVPILFAIWQGFVRSDAAFILGAAIVLTALLPAAWRRGAHRGRLLLQGLAIALIAGAIQLYLQFVLYPHLTYDPGTPVFQIRANLHLHHMGNWMIAVLPVWLPILAVWKLRSRLLLTAADTVALIAGAMYLGLWLTVGLGAEVRVYLPFLLGLCPLAARAVGLLLYADTGADAEPSAAPARTL